MLFLYLFIVVVLIRLLTNIFRLMSTKFYYSLFRNKSRKLNECTTPVGFLFKKAGTQHVIMIKERHAVTQMSSEYISNCLTDPTSYDKLAEIFEKTIGVYKYRIRQTFYPMYWLTLPTTILATINIQPNKIISFFINLVFWLLSFFAAYFLEKYLDFILPTDLVERLASWIK